MSNAPFCVTILRSPFNGKAGRNIELLHYAVQIDGHGIYEFGRYDGPGKLKHRGGRYSNEEVVTAFKVTGHTPEDVIAYMKAITNGKVWEYLGTNCVSVAKKVTERYGPSQCLRLLEAGENNYTRVAKALLKECSDLVKWE